MYNHLAVKMLYKQLKRDWVAEKHVVTDIVAFSVMTVLARITPRPDHLYMSVLNRQHPSCVLPSPPKLFS